MAVITAQVVAHHANALLTLIDNTDAGPLEVCPPATVEMDGLEARFRVADLDGEYEIILRPTGHPGTRAAGIPDPRW